MVPIQCIFAFGRIQGFLCSLVHIANHTILPIAVILVVLISRNIGKPGLKIFILDVPTVIIQSQDNHLQLRHQGQIVILDKEVCTCHILCGVRHIDAKTAFDILDIHPRERSRRSDDNDFRCILVLPEIVHFDFHESRGDIGSFRHIDASAIRIELAISINSRRFLNPQTRMPKFIAFGEFNDRAIGQIHKNNF